MMRIFFLIAAFFLSPLNAFADQVNPLQLLYEEAVRAYASQDYQRAKELFEKTLEVYPKLAASYNYLGLIDKDMGIDRQKVLENFQKAIEVDPNFSPAYDNLGKFYYSQGDYTRAEEYCLKALAISPQDAGTRLSLAWIYLIGKSDPHQAISYFQQALKDSGDIPYAYFGLGMAYFMTDNRSKVLGMITKLRDLNEEKMAEELEHMIRDNRYVPTTLPGMPLRSTTSSAFTAGQQARVIKDVPVEKIAESAEGKKTVRLSSPVPVLSTDNDEPSVSGAQRIRQLQKKDTHSQ